MKAVVTSFSMSLLEAQAINTAVRGVKNRSAWIVDACLQKIKRIDKTQDAIDNATVEQLLSALHYHNAISHQMRWMIQENWDNNAENRKVSWESNAEKR